MHVPYVVRCVVLSLVRLEEVDNLICMLNITIAITKQLHYSTGVCKA